jgi:hypothetical protein
MEILDARDKFSLFGEKLSELLAGIIQDEEEDFGDQMFELAYDELTEQEHRVLLNWVENTGEDFVSRELLAKCPHPYATAYLLMWMIEGVKDDRSGQDTTHQASESILVDK